MFSEKNYRFEDRKKTVFTVL